MRRFVLYTVSFFAAVMIASATTAQTTASSDGDAAEMPAAVSGQTAEESGQAVEMSGLTAEDNGLTAEDNELTAAESGQTPAAEDATPEQLWNAANSAYIDGRFDEAAEIYGRLLESGVVSSELYYNVANACFRKGDTARAILYYNRALVLDPSDEDTRHNLAIAESRTKDKIEAIPEFFLSGVVRSVRNALGCTAWTVISLAMLAAMLTLGIVFLLAERYGVRKGAFFGMVFSALFFVCATLFAASQRRALTDRTQAIVTASAAPVKSSPDRSATDLFVLHEGAKVTIVGTLDNWSEIVIADGKKGWIENSKTERI